MVSRPGADVRCWDRIPIGSAVIVPSCVNRDVFSIPAGPRGRARSRDVPPRPWKRGITRVPPGGVVARLAHSESTSRYNGARDGVGDRSLVAPEGFENAPGKDGRAMASTTTRRRFLGRGAQALGLLALAGRRQDLSRGGGDPRGRGDWSARRSRSCGPARSRRGLVDRARAGDHGAGRRRPCSARGASRPPTRSSPRAWPTSKGSSGPRGGCPRPRTPTTRPRSP